MLTWWSNSVLGVSRLAQREMNKSILQAQGMVLVGMSGVGRWKFQKCHFLNFEGGGRCLMGTLFEEQWLGIVALNGK